MFLSGLIQRNHYRPFSLKHATPISLIIQGAAETFSINLHDNLHDARREKTSRKNSSPSPRLSRRLVLIRMPSRKAGKGKRFYANLGMELKPVLISEN
jgi:hypothetical protein